MRATIVALVVVVLVLATTATNVCASGFAFSLSEGTHEEHGAINGTVTAVYPDGLTFSWGIDDVPEMVYDPDMRLSIEFTVLGASNWKEAWVKTRKGDVRVSLKGINPNPGSILTCELPAECLVPDHLNSIAMVVKDRGSNHRILWIKLGVTNWSASLIRVRMITPLFDERCWSPVTYKGVTVTARQVFLLSHNGGLPSIGSVDLDLLKQLVERQMSEPAPAVAEPAQVPQSASVQPTLTATADPPEADLMVRLLGSATAFRVELPQGSRGEYSLTQTDTLVWQAWTRGTAPFSVPQDGPRFLKLRAFLNGQVGPVTCWDSYTNAITIQGGE